MSNTTHIKRSGHATCDNCRRTFTANGLNDIKDLAQRVDAGGIVPSGECPDCGALCYPSDAAGQPIPQKMHVLVEMFGGCINTVNVIGTDARAAGIFIEQMKGGKDSDPLPGFDAVSESAYGSLIEYAQALYTAHRDAIEGSDYNKTEIFWYESEVASGDHD